MRACIVREGELQFYNGELEGSLFNERLERESDVARVLDARFRRASYVNFEIDLSHLRGRHRRRRLLFMQSDPLTSNP